MSNITRLCGYHSSNAPAVVNHPCVVCRCQKSIASLERALAFVHNQARQEIADIADGRTPNVENAIFDAIMVIQALRGPAWKDLAAAQARIAALTEALEASVLGYCRICGMGGDSTKQNHWDHCPIRTLLTEAKETA